MQYYQKTYHAQAFHQKSNPNFLETKKETAMRREKINPPHFCLQHFTILALTISYRQ